MTEKYAKTKTAMHFAGLNQQRFNEVCARGHYPCAPQTVAGSSRKWSRDDLVALRFYGWKTGDGVIPRFAGELACELLSFMSDYPGDNVAFRVRYGGLTGVGLRRASDLIEVDGHVTVLEGGLQVVVDQCERLDIRRVREDASWAIANEAEVERRIAANEAAGLGN